MQIDVQDITNNLRFAGQYFDAETGLYYNLNRYYDPTIGRYLRADPFGQGLNLYSYCFNNPHSWIDPLGLCAYNKVSGWVHGGLAALGMIPGIGIVPDLIDAGLYLLESNLLDASISGAAAIPVIGLFTRGGQHLYKFGKWLVKSEKVGDLLKSGWKVVNNNIGAVGDIGSLTKTSKKPSIKWDQNSQRWRDIDTGQYAKGPEMPKGFGKPSTWKEGAKDVTNEMIATKEGQKVYEKMRDSSIQDDFAGAFEHALKDLLKKK